MILGLCTLVLGMWSCTATVENSVISTQIPEELQTQLREANPGIPSYSITCVGPCGGNATVCGLEGFIGGGQAVVQCKCSGCYMDAQINGAPVDDPGELPLNSYNLFLAELSAHVLDVCGYQEFTHKSLELGTGPDWHFVIHDYILPNGKTGSVMYYEGPDTKYRIDCVATQCDCREKFIAPNQFECTCQADCTMTVEEIGTPTNKE